MGDDFARKDGTVDGILLGATAGAAIGGVVGAGRGLVAQSSDTVSVVDVHHNVSEPVLEGHRYYVRSDWDTDCWGTGEHRRCDRDLDGWWHTYQPRIRNRIVGSFTEPQIQHSNPGTFLGNAVAGAAIGAGIGAGVGLALGVVGRMVGAHPLERESLSPEAREKLVENTGNNVMSSTALGAGIGATVGLGAGLMEKSGAVKVSTLWRKPLTTTKNLGQIPRNHYEWNRGFGNWNRPSNYRDHSPSGTKNVHRTTPVLDRSGTPRMEQVTKDLDSTRFGPMTGLIGGAVVGAGIGLGVGIATSILDRAMMDSGPNKQ